MVSNSKDLSGLSVLGCFAHPDDEGACSRRELGVQSKLIFRGLSFTGEPAVFGGAAPKALR